MSFRRRVEQAHSERSERQFEETRRLAREKEQQQEADWLRNKARDELLGTTRDIFDSYINPLFVDLTRVVRVNMSVDAYRASFWSDPERKLQSIPQRNGYTVTEGADSQSASVTGDLVWHFTDQGYHRGGASWRHISVGVTHESVTIGNIEGIRLLSANGQQELEDRLLDLVRKGGIEDSAIQWYNRNAPDSP